MSLNLLYDREQKEPIQMAGARELLEKLNITYIEAEYYDFTNLFFLPYYNELSFYPLLNLIYLHLYLPAAFLNISFFLLFFDISPMSTIHIFHME